MARQNHGPLSRAKGKLGGVVYQQYEGMQIAREYQPVVKNPQTEKQMLNRASFKLASQILAEFKNVIVERLAKTSIYTRKRRGIAINRIMSVVSVADPEYPAAVVDQVVNAINEASISGLAAPAITTVSNNHSIVAADGDTVVYNKADYDNNGKLIDLESAIYTSDGTAKTVTPAQGYDSSVVMAVAFRATTEDGRATLDNLTLDRHASEFNVGIERAVAAGDVEITNMSSNVVLRA